MPLDCITSYIMEDAVGDMYLRRLPQRRLDFIDGYISSYYYIINLIDQLENIRQSNKLASVLCNFESNHVREKEEKKKRAT